MPFCDTADAQVPIPVQELLLNKPTPQLTENKKNNKPPLQKQSEICFVPDESVKTVVATTVIATID